jgi:hypothetical protein
LTPCCWEACRCQSSRMNSTRQSRLTGSVRALELIIRRKVHLAWVRMGGQQKRRFLLMSSKLVSYSQILFPSLLFALRHACLRPLFLHSTCEVLQSTNPKDGFQIPFAIVKAGQRTTGMSGLGASIFQWAAGLSTHQGAVRTSTSKY